MTNNVALVNTIAPLKNVGLFSALVDRVVHRTQGLPGMAVFHGWSGFGKTFSATYAANKHGAFYVEVGDSWTRKKLCQAILQEMGMDTRGTISDLVDRIIEGLVGENRPLIIDEFDHVLAKNYFETVREIHDKSGAAIVLIGEERLPAKIKALPSDRFHNRMLDWVAAQPTDLEDCRHLARLYCPDGVIEDDLLKRVHESSQGRVRRVCVNLDRIREAMVTESLETINLAQWNNRPLFTGDIPTRRAV